MGIERRKGSLIGSGLLAVACILYIVANALPIWSKLYITRATATNIGLELLALDIYLEIPKDFNSITVTCGLWRIYVSIDGQSQYIKWPTDESSYIDMKVTTARTFVTMTCILTGIASICVLGCAITSVDAARRLTKVAKSLPFVTLVAGLIGVGVSINLTSLDNLLQYGAAASLGMVALLFNLVGAIVTVLIK